MNNNKELELYGMTLCLCYDPLGNSKVNDCHNINIEKDIDYNYLKYRFNIIKYNFTIPKQYWKMILQYHLDLNTIIKHGLKIEINDNFFYLKIINDRWDNILNNRILELKNDLDSPEEINEDKSGYNIIRENLIYDDINPPYIFFNTRSKTFYNVYEYFSVYDICNITDMLSFSCQR